MLHREVSLHPCCSGVRGKIAGFEISLGFIPHRHTIHAAPHGQGHLPRSSIAYARVSWAKKQKELKL